MSGGSNQINKSGTGVFPRELTSLEKDYLFYLLPEDKPGYKIYRDKINNMLAAGLGSSGQGSLVLSSSPAAIEGAVSFSPVFAAGTIEFDGYEIDIIIHEEIDGEIEIELSGPAEVSAAAREIKRWTYSLWTPGCKAPGDNTWVREEILSPGRFVFVIAPAHKKLWVYEYQTGVNHIIPVSNYYNHLMLVKGIRQPDVVLKPALLFDDLPKYNSEEIVSAFILYNKYMKHINLVDNDMATGQAKGKKFLKFFK